MALGIKEIQAKILNYGSKLVEWMLWIYDVAWKKVMLWRTGKRPSFSHSTKETEVGMTNIFGEQFKQGKVKVKLNKAAKKQKYSIRTRLYEQLISFDFQGK